jgi:hypothetical protein
VHQVGTGVGEPDRAGNAGSKSKALELEGAGNTSAVQLITFANCVLTQVAAINAAINRDGAVEHTAPIKRDGSPKSERSAGISVTG